jgi:peptidoglycan/LPS O-acetylase OafA/YrhL
MPTATDGYLSDLEQQDASIVGAPPSLLRQSESPNLDLLRSVAVLAVLANHLAATFGIAQPEPRLWGLGRWGVLLFFVHTSLVLMMSMGRLGLSGWKLHSTFYIKRFFRIYPLSIAIIILAVAAKIPPTSWPDDIPHSTLRSIICNLFLCQNLFRQPDVLGPLWSLPFEVQMYLVLPLLFVFVRKCTSGSIAALWYVTIGAAMLQPWLVEAHHGRQMQLDRLGIAQFVPCFMAGIIAYYLLISGRRAVLPFWVWTATLFTVSWIYVQRWNGTEHLGYTDWLCCLAIGVVVVFCAESEHRTLNFLTHHVAKYSFGLYLGQLPALWFAFLKLKGHPLWMQWAVFLFLITAGPYLLYHLIEAPFIKLGKTVSKPKPSPAVGAGRG